MVCVLVAIFTPYRMAFADNDSVLWLTFDAAVDTVFLIGEFGGTRRRYYSGRDVGIIRGGSSVSSVSFGAGLRGGVAGEEVQVLREMFSPFGRCQALVEQRACDRSSESDS